MAPLADGIAAAWPLLVAIAAAIAFDRHRSSRRREALNRALHELRRPLHFLALAWSGPSAPAHRAAATRGHLAAAHAALVDLDAEVNGRRLRRRQRLVPADALLREAIERWRAPAALLGRRLELRVPGDAVAVAVPGEAEALSRALDNLLANALDHGCGGIRVEATTRQGRLRIAVIDGEGHGADAFDRAASGAPEPGDDPRRGRRLDLPEPGDDPRRGHGLDLVARIASRHGGRLAFVREPSRTCATLELPLVREPARRKLPAANRDAA